LHYPKKELSREELLPLKKLHWIEPKNVAHLKGDQIAKRLLQRANWQWDALQRGSSPKKKQPLIKVWDCFMNFLRMFSS
jgi:hypothetical protein